MDGGSVRTKNVLILPGFATTKLIATTKVMRKTAVSRNMFKLILILWKISSAGKYFCELNLNCFLVHLGKFLEEEPRHTCACFACNSKGCADVTGDECDADPECGM